MRFQFLFTTVSASAILTHIFCIAPAKIDCMKLRQRTTIFVLFSRLVYESFRCNFHQQRNFTIIYIESPFSTQTRKVMINIFKSSSVEKLCMQIKDAPEYFLLSKLQCCHSTEILIAYIYGFWCVLWDPCTTLEIQSSIKGNKTCQPWHRLPAAAKLVSKMKKES